MFKLFAANKRDCFHCAHPNSAHSHFCEQCGTVLTQSEKVLALAEDDIAQRFTVPRLESFLSETKLAGLSEQIQILQYDKTYALLPEDQDLIALQRRFPFLVLTASAQLLISRRSRFVLSFSFDDLHTAEFLAMTAKFDVHLQIASMELFVARLLAGAQRLNKKNLQALLAPMLRQLAMEFINKHALRELQDHPQLQTELNQVLTNDLSPQLAELGLNMMKLSTQELKHEKMNAEREHLGEKLGTLVLIADERRAQVAHSQQIASLYSEREWQKVAQEEQQVRMRYRREEMRQQFAKDLSWLYLHKDHEDAKKRLSRAKLRQDESERLHAIQLRELELYARIADASCRKDAIERGAQSTVQELEHTLIGKGETRQNEADQWLHIRTLARIKMRSESELAQLHSKQAAQLLQQQMAHQLQLQQWQHEMAQNSLNSDKELQTTRAAILREKQIQLAQREQEIDDEAHKNRLMNLSIETEVRAREFQRMQAWEEELHQQRKHAAQREESVKALDTEFQLSQMQERIHKLQRSEQQSEALAQHEKLLRTLEAHAKFEQQQQDLRLEQEDRQWQRQQQSVEAEQAHQAELASKEIARMQAIASLSETGKIAVAQPENAAALVELMKLQTQASMSAEQILATQAGQSAHAANAMSELGKGKGLSWEETVRMLHQRVQEEREQRNLEQERRHQIDLSIMQNAVQESLSKPQSRK